jgi:two-component system OmpR family sensor kinase
MIRDTGIGMKENELDDMFNRYTRFDSCEGGFGIGLNIVKTIIDEYNLKVSVESHYGEGTTIRIDFTEGIPET